MKYRNELITKLNNKILSGTISRRKMKEAVDYMEMKHCIEQYKAYRLINGTEDLNNVDDFQLFCILESFDHVEIKDNINTERYFTEKETLIFSNKKLQKTDTKDEIYPVIINDCTKVNDDQWVSVVDTNFLMDMYNKQLIRYNPRTQRNLKKRIRGSNVMLSINIKESSVNEISNLLKSHTFISNYLSFNLNADDPETDFNFSDGKMVINNGQMDIIDGYHRFRAIIKTKAEDPDFNYRFLVNIMNFDEAKACNFISQEDKRNKIEQSYVRSMDVTNLANFVVKRLNEDSSSYLYGKINRTGTGVDQVSMSGLINLMFKIQDRREAFLIEKYLMNIFNRILERKDDITAPLSFNELAVSIYIASKSYSLNSDTDYSKEIANYVVSKNIELSNMRIAKPLLNELDKKVNIKEVIINND